MKLNGKVAILIGAAGKDNMGQVIARHLSEEGAQVVVAGREPARFRAFAESIGAVAFDCDITEKAQVDALAAMTLDRFGKVNIGVNSTGWGLLCPFLDNKVEDIDRMTAVQFRGPFLFMQAMVRAMSTGGSIIQISSATATIMLDHHAAYMGTKAGIDHVVRCVANEFGKSGIRANSISPGVTASPMAGDALNHPAVLAAFTKEYPLGRIGTSADIAEAVVWLSSDKCFMTGQNLQVNGGLTLRRNPSETELFSVMPADAIAHLTS